MNSTKYDNLLLNEIGTTHIKYGTVYYDNLYFDLLKNKLSEDGLLDAYKNELKENSKGIKMCSIASSSRFCYIASKGVYKEMDEFEKDDISYGCCRPHYDGYSSSLNTFYEFKCHEFCNNSHDCLSESYNPLLKEVYDINISDPSKLRFSDFGIKVEDDPLINKINFDFKQFICHIFGIIAHIKNTNNKATLKYVWIIPSQTNDKELDDFIFLVKSQIDSIFKQFLDLTINLNNKKVKVKDLIILKCDIRPQSDFNDFILKEL